MNRPKGRIYSFLFFACVAGYAWIFLNSQIKSSVTVCPIKSVTGIPCPSCGTTRSVLALFKGAFHEALWLNPLGIIAALGLLIAPVWILMDTIRSQNTLGNAYYQTQNLLQKPLVFIPLVLLLLINWYWNIHKEGISW
jgi:hypothetical protein